MEENIDKIVNTSAVKPAVIASVYSATEIARHRNRMKRLKSISDDDDDNSDDDSIASDEDDQDESDLDINIRIFEELKSDDNIIGEMLCNIKGGSNSNLSSSTSDIDQQLSDVSCPSPAGSFKVMFSFDENSNSNCSTSFDLVTTNDASQSINDDYEVVAEIPEKHYFSQISNMCCGPLKMSKTKNRKVTRKLDQPSITELENITIAELTDVELTNIELSKSADPASFDAEPTKTKDTSSDDEESIIHLDSSEVDFFASKALYRKRTNSDYEKMKVLYKSKSDEQRKNVQQRTLFDYIYYNPSKKEEPDVGPNLNALNDESETEIVKNELTDELFHAEKTEPPNAIVPQIKVDADGNIVLDKSSLYVEQSSVTKARVSIAKSGIILESENHTNNYRKKRTPFMRWTPRDTLSFYLMLNAVGTDFTLIGNALKKPRNSIKQKYLKEERLRPYLIDNALKTVGTFDIEYMRKQLNAFESELEAERAKKIKAKKSRKVSKNSKVKE